MFCPRILRQVLLPIILCLLTACVAQPEPTVAVTSTQIIFPTSTASPSATLAPTPTQWIPPTPTPVPSLSPRPTSTNMPTSPLTTGAAIRFESWSPNGDWLAYWWSTAADVATNAYPFPPGVLRFLNVNTGQICTDPEFIAHDHDDRLVWQSTGQVIVLSSGHAYIGQPCDKDFKPIAYHGPEATIEPNSALSPNGRYRATTDSDVEADGTLSVTTTITNVLSGRVENAIEWNHRGGLGGLGLGGQWLTDDRFLIQEPLGRGPLLVRVGGEVIQVAPELFELPSIINSDPENFVYLRADGSVITEANTYHIVISGVGSEVGFPQVRLYHSESDEVEILPFKYVWWPAFSPDGRWLLLRSQVYRNNHEEPALWIRPVDPVNSQARPFAEDANYTLWTSDWTKVATSAQKTVSIYTFPDGQLVGTWTTDEYELVPIAWSSDGHSLAVEGYVPGLDRAALFVIRWQ